MRKREADNIPKVEIKELRAAGFFSGKESGGVLYRSPFDGGLYRFVISNVFILTYKIRNIPQKERSYGRIIPIDQIDAMWASLKKYSYRGKPTKRFLRVQKKTADFNKALERAGATHERIEEVMEKETTE